jgi:hypothetical protein
MDIEYVSIDNGVYATYLGKCNLSPITVYPSTDSPARVYNNHIRDSKAKYICFIHADVTCYGLTEAIERTIQRVGDFGALGIVGTNKGTKWGHVAVIQEVMTLDSCCIIINQDYGVLFDEHTFDSYHLVIEDYCMQVRNLGYKNYVIDINAYEWSEGLQPIKPYAIHHSHTLNKLGCAWGEWRKYRKLLEYKWGIVETT